MAEDYIAARAPILKWEILFNATFYNWISGQVKDNLANNLGPLIRAKEYSLPESVAPHIAAVFNTVQLPPQIARGTAQGAQPVPAGSTSVVSSISFLNSLYGITSNAGSKAINQSVFSTGSEYFSPADLACRCKPLSHSLATLLLIVEHQVSVALKVKMKATCLMCSFADLLIYSRYL